MVSKHLKESPLQTLSTWALSSKMIVTRWRLLVHVLRMPESTSTDSNWPIPSTSYWCAKLEKDYHRPHYQWCLMPTYRAPDNICTTTRSIIFIISAWLGSVMIYYSCNHTSRESHGLMLRVKNSDVSAQSRIQSISGQNPTKWTGTEAHYQRSTIP